MIPIFVASNTGYSGRTFISLGLAMKLIELGYKVGYIKPIGKVPVKKGREVYDADAMFIKEMLGLTELLLQGREQRLKRSELTLKAENVRVRDRACPCLRLGNSDLFLL